MSPLCWGLEVEFLLDLRRQNSVHCLEVSSVVQMFLLLFDEGLGMLVCHEIIDLVVIGSRYPSYL